jgi:hypothetical protein
VGHAAVLSRTLFVTAFFGGIVSGLALAVTSLTALPPVVVVTSAATLCVAVASAVALAAVDSRRRGVSWRRSLLGGCRDAIIWLFDLL